MKQPFDTDELVDSAGVSHTGEIADVADLYTDADAEAAINNDSDHGSTAPHNYYTDSQARSAVDGSSVSITGDAGSVDGYDVQKNGTDGAGIINFKT